MAKDLQTYVLQIIGELGPVSVLRIREYLHSKYAIATNLKAIDQLLYGPLRDRVVRDRDEAGYPTWRIKTVAFEAAQGLEVLFYSELLQRGIVTEDDSFLGYQIRNRRNGKTYDLDIAIIREGLKLNIEIDGFEHIRADARLSIQEQLEQRGENTEIEIDWMDNKNSFTDFKLINNKHLFRWFAQHRDWVKRYHEELLKPHDITRNIWLIENSWTVMRFWNFEIKEELERCIQDIQSYLT